MPCLVDQVETRHGDELARQLAEAEVYVVISGVDRARQQPARLDSEQQRFDLARGDRHRHRRRVVAHAHTVVAPGSQRHAQQLALARGGRLESGSDVAVRPAPITTRVPALMGWSLGTAQRTTTASTAVSAAPTQRIRARELRA